MRIAQRLHTVCKLGAKPCILKFLGLRAGISEIYLEYACQFFSVQDLKVFVKTPIEGLTCNRDMIYRRI